MNHSGINFNWLWVYSLGAFIGLLFAEVIEKTAKAIWARIGPKGRKLSPKIQRGKLILLTDKHKSKIINSNQVRISKGSK
jgi:hypothetical protein